MMRSKRALAALLAAITLAAGCTSGGDDSAADDEQAAGDGSVFEGVAFTEPVPKPDFTLTDTEGRPYDFAAETDGATTFLFFGYTFCPDICPVHLNQLGEILERPGAPVNVQVVFVSVDPDRDTPEVIRDFLDRFDSDFVGLTGTPEELAAAQEAAGLPVAFKETDDPDDEQYTVGHYAAVLAFAPNGLGYTQYPMGTKQTEYAHDLEILGELRTVDDVPAA
ncbi:MAG: SCO family protein [Acidimicrobiia bacterium]|nr:SCO family protein [Acidimicrobiia bacterium]